MFQQEFITLPFNKYNDLINQNFELKNKLGVFDKQNSEYFLQNVNNIITIDCLQLQIVHLEEENKSLNERVSILERENADIKRENADIKRENADIKRENADIKNILLGFTNKALMEKIIMVIQDLNATFELEKNINDHKLYKLRDYRNSFCHYIDDKNDDDFIKFKKYEFVLEKLTDINNTIKKKIETLYGRDIINKIINYVRPKLIYNFDNVSDIDEEELYQELNIFWE
jgi:FtsZ-binding cell division protein ZapB